MSNFIKRSYDSVIAFIDRCADCIDDHFEDSLSVSQEEANALVKRLKSGARSDRRSRAARAGKQLKGLVRIKTQPRSSEESELKLAKVRWFETEESYLGGGKIKKHSSSFYRLEAFVATVDPDDLKGAELVSSGRLAGL